MVDVDGGLLVARVDRLVQLGLVRRLGAAAAQAAAESAAALAAADGAADDEEREEDDRGDDEGERGLQQRHVVDSRVQAPVAAVSVAAHEPASHTPAVILVTRDTLPRPRGARVRVDQVGHVGHHLGLVTVLLDGVALQFVIYSSVTPHTCHNT